MFRGSIVALVTPFCNGEIDEKSLRHLVLTHIHSGTQALVVNGSTGEGSLLRKEEKRHTLQIALEFAGDMPIIAGCGSASTYETLRAIQDAQSLGCAAALVVAPYYVKPTLSGLMAHFHELVKVGLPIILYNNPGRTVVDMPVHLIAELSTHPLIVGVKDSHTDISRVTQLRALTAPDFALLGGDDPYCAAFLASGGDGYVSVAGNIVPQWFSTMYQAWESGDLKTFGILRDQLMLLSEVLFKETNPCPIKYAASRLGLCRNEVRLPLVPISEKLATEIDITLNKLQLIPEDTYAATAYCG